MPRIGRMRHRVELQRLTERQDDVGGVSLEWNTYATVWAAVEPIRGREYFIREQVAGDVSHRVVMRWRSGVSVRDRVLHDGRQLEVESVLDRDERRVELELMAREVAA